MTRRTGLMGRTVILAAGDFPRRGSDAWNLLATATRVIACDRAAATYRRRFKRAPDILVGDLDSFHGRLPIDCRVVKDSNQDENDLAKALTFCRRAGWTNLVIVGATGRRTDHTIGNIYRALEAEVPVVTDFGAFYPVRGRLRLRTAPGTGVSVFASDARAQMTSKGLVWPLAGVRFTNPFCATLNRARGRLIEVTSNVPAFVFVAREGT